MEKIKKILKSIFVPFVILVVIFSFIYVVVATVTFIVNSVNEKAVSSYQLASFIVSFGACYVITWACYNEKDCKRRKENKDGHN